MKLTLTLKEAAEELGLSENKMYEIVHMQDFPAMKIGRNWKISREGLAEWIREKAKERAEV